MVPDKFASSEVNYGLLTNWKDNGKLNNDNNKVFTSLLKQNNKVQNTITRSAEHLQDTHITRKYMKFSFGQSGLVFVHIALRPYRGFMVMDPEFRDRLELYCRNIKN